MKIRTRCTGIAAPLALCAVLTACSSGTGTATGDARDGGGTAMQHVHGLGVDPADGVLYAAAHDGLFRLSGGGRATRVADRHQDTMGFTVTGPGTFLGSGHPDADDDPRLPSPLGLVRSVDAARTWRTVSLAGEADFHALRAGNGVLYGWDAVTGQLLASASDGREWTAQSRLALRDLAVSPTDAEALLATTEQGLLRSGDGGRTWGTVPGAPRLVVLAWSDPVSLYGVAPDGSVAVSPDGGSSWTTRGDAGGVPQAVAAVTRGGATALHVALGDEGGRTSIVTSTDGGATFIPTYSG